MTLTNGSLLSQSTQFQIASVGSSPIAFYTGATQNSMTSGTQRMIIGTNGNVGIGTTSPTASLHIVSSGNDKGLILDSLPGNNYEGLQFRTGGSDVGYLSQETAIMYMGAASQINFRTGSGSSVGGTDRMVINSSGNVGIGTTSPISKFHVQGNGSEMVSFTSVGGIHLSNSYDGGYGVRLAGIDNGVNGHDIRIQTRNSISGSFVNSLSVTSSGNVGIGTTTPNSLLEVRKGAGGGAVSVGSVDVMTLENSDTAYLNIITPTNRTGGILFSDDVRARGQLTYDHTTDGMNFITAGSQRAVITSAGNLGIGTTTPDAALHVKGGTAMTAGWNRTATLEATYPSLVFNSANTKWAGIQYDHSSNLNIRVGATSNDLNASGVNALSFNASTGAATFASTVTGTTLNGTTGINTGAGAGTQRIDASGNLVNIGTISSGAITSGLINGQTISSAANFTGTVAVATDVTSPNYKVTAVEGNGICFWANCTNYKISMGTGASYVYGPVSSYSIKMQMDSASTDRGFTWGRAGLAPIAALNSTSGNFQTAGSVTVGTTLNVTGQTTLGNASSSALTATNLYGTNGKLSGTLNVTGQTTLGNASTTGFTSTGGTFLATAGGNVGIGMTNPAYKLDVTGEINASAGLYIGSKLALTMPSNNPETGPWNPIWNTVGASKPLYFDEEFASGTNSVGVYNNSGGSAVTITRETGQTGVPNSTGAWLKVSYDGIGATSPGFGGVIQTINSAPNKTFVQRFRAKVPVGKTLVIAENSQGTNPTSYWLTNNVGTGKWEDYIRVSHTGNTGTFSSGGHIYVTGGSGAFDWYIASMNVYEANVPLYASANTWLSAQTFNGGANFPASGIWNTSGNVGIGTTTPTAPLSIVKNRTNGSTYVQQMMDADTMSQTVVGSGIVTGYSRGGGATYFGAIGGYANGSVPGMGIWAAPTVSAAGVISTTPNLFVASGGNVAIGTTTATQMLTLAGGDIDFMKGDTGAIRRLGEISFDWTSTGSYDNPQFHGIQSKDEGGNFADDLRINSYSDIIHTIDSNANDANSRFVIQKESATNGTDLFAVDETGKMSVLGNVGIGTDPTNKLHVLGASNDTISSTNLNVKFQGDGGNGLGFGTLTSSPFTSYIQSGYVADLSIAQYGLALNPNGGNVGIGTTTPGYKVSVAGVTPTMQLYDSTQKRGALFGVNDGYNAVVDAIGGTLLLKTNGTTWMTVGNGGTATTFDTGNVGIGYSDTGTTKLAVNGNIGVGTTTAFSLAKLLIDNTTSANGATSAISGIHGNYNFNPTAGGVQVGNRFVVNNMPTTNANTSVGQIVRTIDNTALANTVRGMEIVSNAGSNTAGINTGIRTTGATFGLQAFTSGLAGGVTAPAALYGESTGTTVGDILRLYTSSMTTASYMAQFYQEASTFSGTGLYMNLGTGGGSFTGNFVNFQNADVSKFIIDSTGKVGIGTSTLATTMLTVAGDIRVGNSGTNGCIQGFGGATLTGTCTSDERLKANVTDVPSVLAKFAGLRVVNYTWNDLASSTYSNGTTATQTGYIAQNVEAVFPELVNTNAQGFKEVNYSTLGLYSVKAVSELFKKTETDIKVVNMFIPEQAVDAGTVVAFGTSTHAVQSSTDVSTSSPFLVAGIRKATTTVEAIGVVTSIMGVTPDTVVEGGIPVAFSGRVMVQVTNENGEINAGDYLALSTSTPGKAVRMTSEGQTLGVAVSGDNGNGKVLMVLNTGYQKVDMTSRVATTTGMLTTGNIDLNANGVAIYNIKSLASANGTWSIDENGRITAKELCIDGSCADGANFADMIASGRRNGAMQIVNGYAYLLNIKTFTLRVLDTTSEAVVGSLTLEAGVSNVAAAGNMLYISNEDMSKLYLVDISNPTTPILTRTMNTDGVIVNSNQSPATSDSGTGEVAGASTTTEPVTADTTATESVVTDTTATETSSTEPVISDTTATDTTTDTTITDTTTTTTEPAPIETVTTEATPTETPTTETFDAATSGFTTDTVSTDTVMPESDPVL